MFFSHKNTSMFTLRSGLFFYLKTKSSICHNFLDIRVIFAAHCENLHARADAASINQALLKCSHWKRLSSRDQWNLSSATMCRGSAADALEQGRPCTCTNATTSNFNSHILKKNSQMRLFWSQSRALIIHVFLRSLFWKISLYLCWKIYIDPKCLNGNRSNKIL